MRTLRNFIENVNAENITAIKANLINNELYMEIDIKDDSIIFILRDAWDIHLCENLLKKIDEVISYTYSIGFYGWKQYMNKINHYGELLNIRNYMHEFSFNDVLPEQIYEVILDRLLAKHHMEKGGYHAAMKKRPLKSWVQEAYTYFA